MIRHVSVLTFVADATDEQIRRLEAAMALLPAQIPPPSAQAAACEASRL